MPDYVGCEEAAPRFEARPIRVSPRKPAATLPQWREAKFPTREDIFIGLLALGVVLAVLGIAATVLTA